MKKPKPSRDWNRIGTFAAAALLLAVLLGVTHGVAYQIGSRDGNLSALIYCGRP